MGTRTPPAPSLRHGNHAHPEAPSASLRPALARLCTILVCTLTFAMAPAFVLSSVKPVSLAKSFCGSSVTPHAPQSRTRAAQRSTVVMEAYSLDKYTKMSSPPAGPAPGPSKPSATWTSYLDTVKDKFNPFERKKPTTRPNLTYSEAALSVATAPYFIIQGRRSTLDSFKGDPDTNINRVDYLIQADKYMAQCITKQYKMTAAPYGTYNVQCTEGTVRGQAESARKLALSTDFRMRQRSVFQKFADYTETRRKAIIAAHGCTYEETLLAKNPVAARSYLRAGAEAKSVCSRYATDTSAAENYMASSVVRQNMMRKVPNGVYGLMCSDGNESGGAEYKRIQALSAQFRAAQQPKLVKERTKFDSCKFARDSYGHLCSYEENLFNSYPAVSASMRPNSSY